MMASCLAVFAPQAIDSQTFRDVANNCQAMLSAGRFQRRCSVTHRGNGSFISAAVQGAARESALKVLELTAGKLAAFYDSPTGFRHRPKSLVNAAKTLVVVSSPSHPYTRQYRLICWLNFAVTTRQCV